MRQILAALMLVLAAGGAAAPAAEAPEGVESFELANGLLGVVIEDHRAPVVTQMVWYRVGSADDPPGLSGLAHYLEHLMFKATETLGDGEFSRIVRENGGSDNAFTSTDYTAYHQRIASDRLDLVMGMEADRMVNLAPSEASALSERDVVLEERRQVVESAPSGPYNEARRAALFLNHPYGRPVIGWEHEIEALTREAALDFYRRHYAPNNAILVVAGDVETEEVRRLAEKHFGPIPASDAIQPRVRPQEPPHRAPRRIEFADPRVSDASVGRIYLAPQRRRGDQEEAAALTLLAELLGGSAATSEFARDLVFEQAIALGADAWYSGLGLDVQSFGVSVTPRPGTTPAEAEAALDAAITRFVAGGPDPAELDRAKARARAAEVYALDDQARRARRIGAALALGLTLRDVAEWPDLLQEVTPEAVQAAAASVFRIEASVTGLLLPPAEATGELTP